MSTFAQRKAARIATGPIKYKFNVVASFPFIGEVVASFYSRKEADDFANKQIGPLVGNTKAQNVIFERHYKTAHVPDVWFSIQRVTA